MTTPEWTIKLIAGRLVTELEDAQKNLTPEDRVELFRELMSKVTPPTGFFDSSPPRDVVDADYEVKDKSPPIKAAPARPVGRYTASGRLLLPERVKIDVRPSKKKVRGKRQQSLDEQLYDLVYQETLPTVDEEIIKATLDMLESMQIGTEVNVEVRRGKKEVTFVLKCSATHEKVGSILGSEFMGWSPVGTLSITELLVFLVSGGGKIARRAKS